MSNPMYVTHKDTETVLTASECKVVVWYEKNAPTKAAILAKSGNPVADPNKVLWFDADAVRDHFAEDNNVDLSDLTEEEVEDIGAYALNDEELWDMFDVVLRKALEQVRVQRARSALA